MNSFLSLRIPFDRSILFTTRRSLHFVFSKLRDFQLVFVSSLWHSPNFPWSLADLCFSLLFPPSPCPQHVHWACLSADDHRLHVSALFSRSFTRLVLFFSTLSRPLHACTLSLSRSHQSSFRKTALFSKSLPKTKRRTFVSKIHSKSVSWLQKDCPAIGDFLVNIGETLLIEFPVQTLSETNIFENRPALSFWQAPILTLQRSRALSFR